MLTKTMISAEEYLLQEAQAEFKSEYQDGEIVAMAGSSIQHNRIVRNLIGLLFECLKQKGCEILGSDMLLHIAQCNKYVYPDVMILCQNPELSRRNGIDVLLNPTIIIEVLSESTELYDRTRKFECYKTLPSFQEYILIDSQTHLVESYQRTPESYWLLKTENLLDNTVKIADCDVLLKDLYDLVVFEDPSTQKSDESR